MKRSPALSFWAIVLSVLLIMFCLPVGAQAADIYADNPLLPNTLLAGKTIILDPGHSDTSGPAYGSYVEGYYDRLLALAVKENLENCGATVYLTREGPQDVNNCVRMAKVNKWALERLLSKRSTELSQAAAGSVQAQTLQTQIAEINRLIGIMAEVIANPVLTETYFNTPYDSTRQRVIHPDLKRIFELENDPEVYENMLMISLHTNAPGGSDTSINGATSYRIHNTHWELANYYTNYSNVERNLKISTTLLKHVCASVGFKNNGVVVNDLFMLRESNIPVTLLENGYHTNTADREKMVDEASRNRLATGIALGILECFGKTYDRDAILYEGYEKIGLDPGKYSFSGSMLVATGPLSVQSFLDQVTALRGSTLKLLTADGADKAPGDTLVSGDRLKVTRTDNTSTVFPIALRGDLNSDGRIALLDLLMIQKKLLNTMNLSSVQSAAGDVNGDGKVALLDLLLVQKHLLGTQFIQ